MPNAIQNQIICQMLNFDPRYHLIRISAQSDMKGSMQFGISVPNFRGDASLQTFDQLALRAEAIGFDDIWLGDHIILPKTTDVVHPYFPDRHWNGDIPVFEPFTLMGYLAAITDRVRIGLGTLVVPYRNPVETAKMLATADTLSGGRIILGIGIGWLREEFEALDVPWKGRGQRTDEYIALMRELWQNREPSFSGDFYQLPEGLWFEPQPPAGSIPIWVGGNSPAALRRAARIGDGWYGVDLTPDEVRDVVGRLEDELSDQGRDLAGFSFSARIDVEIDGELQAKATEGSAAKVAEAVEEYHAAGLTHFQMATSPRFSTAEVLEQVDRFAEDVKPLLSII
jgi:probable F420-dependent oxidoreductase